MNAIISGRLDALRSKMSVAGIAATIIPHTDAHQSEYLAEHWQVRQWLSDMSSPGISRVLSRTMWFILSALGVNDC